MKINRHLSIPLQEHYYFDEKHIGSSDNVEKSSKLLLFSQFTEKQKQVQQTQQGDSRELSFLILLFSSYFLLCCHGQNTHLNTSSAHYVFLERLHNLSFCFFISKTNNNMQSIMENRPEHVSKIPGLIGQSNVAM